MIAATFIVALCILAVLFLSSIIGSKKTSIETVAEPNREKFFPSGKKMISDSEMLTLSLEELRKWDSDDLRWLINYAGHQMNSDEETKIWNVLFKDASRALYHY